MVGHLFIREFSVVFVDPPNVPGLLEAAGGLGKLRSRPTDRAESHESVEIHSEEAGIQVYLPEATPDAVEPSESCRVNNSDCEVYKAGSVWIPSVLVRR